MSYFAKDAYMECKDSVPSLVHLVDILHSKKKMDAAWPHFIRFQTSHTNVLLF